ncbi:hypothetical protein PENTCL1PPCAC_29950, partial [Pristionchus entomophagus]
LIHICSRSTGRSTMIKLCNCYQSFMETPLSPALSDLPSMFGSTASPVDSAESIEAKILTVIRNFSTVTSSLCISERLPRFDNMIFLNLTTLEGDCYCVELTKKGWRIASLVHDSMNGDFRRMDLFIVYHNSLTELLRGVSAQFENLINESQLFTPSSSSCCSTPRSTSP